MSDIPNSGDKSPRSRADQKLRDAVEVMKTGNNTQVKRAQVEFYTTLRTQLIKASLARAVDPDRFNDLFQETMIAVWDALPTFRGDSSMVTWVHSIFRNKVNDFLRSSGFRRVDPLEHEDELENDALDIPEALSRQQVQRFLEGCLKKLWLTSRNRAVAIEYVRQEYSMEEISASLGVPVGTVKRWLHEARRELASCVQRHGAKGVEG